MAFFQQAATELHRDNRERRRPPVTLPGDVTFTIDMMRAVPSGYGLDARMPTPWEPRA